MRVESDRQGHHSQEAPACHHCGVPLLEETTFCPYCERWLDSPGGPHFGRQPSVATRVSSFVNERALLTGGFVFFALLAVASLVAALMISR